MQNVAEDPVRLNNFQTRHPDQASAIAGLFYAAANFSIDGYAPGFEFRLTNALAGPLLAGVSHNGFAVRIRSEPLGHFVCGVVYKGQATLRAQDRPDRILTPGQVWKFSADDPMDIAYGAESAVGVIGLPLHALIEAAENIEGEHYSVRFLDDFPVDAAVERYWAQLMRSVYRQATHPDSVLNSPLIRAHVIRTLARAALITFPNTTMTAHYQPGVGYVGPITLRRAVAHLHANAGRTITLAELADAAGISARALQKAFIQHYDCSPMAYLRQIRLEAAHRELQDADPAGGDRVRTIAARWGFGHLGRFGSAYQERYGVAPSVTLRE